MINPAINAIRIVSVGSFDLMLAMKSMAYVLIFFAIGVLFTLIIVGSGVFALFRMTSVDEWVELSNDNKAIAFISAAILIGLALIMDQYIGHLCEIIVPYPQKFFKSIEIEPLKSYKSISESEIIYSELMVPHYANFGGKVHGGRVLLIMDNVAFTVATKHASSYCVTASVEGVDFLAPVEVGTLLVIKSRVNYTGNTSMIIGMRVETHNPITGKIIHTNSSYFTMVSIDQESKKPKKIPGC